MAQAIETALQKKPGLAFAAEAEVEDGKPEVEVQMLSEGKVELIVLPLPFTANPAVRAATRTIGTTGDAVGINQLGMWVVRQPFLDKNRAALADFMEDALRQQRWYLDPANHAEAVKIAAEVTKTPPDRWDSWLFKKDG